MSGYISETKALIDGRMREVTDALRIDERAYRQHILCVRPQHADRKPSFRIDLRKERAFCTCGSWDALDLARDVLGLPDLLAAADWARQALGLPGRDGRQETPAERRAREVRIAEAQRLAGERQRQREREEAEDATRTLAWIREKLWPQVQNVAGTPADAYLRARGIDLPEWPFMLGFLEAYGADRLPAMAAFFGIPDEPEPGILSMRPEQIAGIHLTFLKADGSGKAQNAEGKSKIIVGRGHTVPLVLAPPDDRLTLAIGEGIEKSLAWHQAEGWGCWAAGTANRLPGLAAHIPTYIECVNLIEDPDPAGLRYTLQLADAITELGNAEVNTLRGKPSHVA